ncbi:MAG: hypothetical protein GF364_17040 [Candidatus Lokiarchaeota archaeon]|nr:hypothetical protein [Candidatus Lokiarchaeota archaeon]
MQKSILNPPKNPVIDKFFEQHPRSHFLKFILNHHLHRLFAIVVFKVMYWCWFKIMNRIELQGKRHIEYLKSHYENSPFLIIENHVSNTDVLMHYSIWGHLGFMTYVFTSSSAFHPKHPQFTNLTHFIEMIPRYGTGKSNVLRMLRRLLRGDIVNLFTAGTYPSGEYSNTGLVQEGFSGGTRLAYQYWKKTGKKLLIQPVCSIGANKAYPPRSWLPPKPKLNHKIIVKFGEPFFLDFSEEITYDEIKEKTKEMQMKIAEIWNQKRLIPNYSKIRHRDRSGGTGKPRVYGHKRKRRTKKWKKRRKNGNYKKMLKKKNYTRSK